MATQKQIDAARRNGARSRGPVTAEGRAKSSRNSLKHGITAKTFFILANESEEKFDRVVDGFFQHYQPANDVEEELCVSIAHAHWRIRRLAIIETGLLDREMLSKHDESGNIDEGIRLADAFETLAAGSGALRLVTQYETRLYRTFHRLIDRLEKIQKDRKESSTGIPACVSCKNEPDSPVNQTPSTTCQPAPPPVTPTHVPQPVDQPVTPTPPGSRDGNGAVTTHTAPAHDMNVPPNNGQHPPENAVC